MLPATVSWSRDDGEASSLKRPIPSRFPTTAPYAIPTRWVRERTRATSLSWLWGSTGINLASGKILFASLSDSSFSVVSTAIFIPAVLRREGPEGMDGQEPDPFLTCQFQQFGEDPDLDRGYLHECHASREVRYNFL